MIAIEAICTRVIDHIQMPPSVKAADTSEKNPVSILLPRSVSKAQMSQI
jgi:hypothetical protein